MRILLVCIALAAISCNNKPSNNQQVNTSEVKVIQSDVVSDSVFTAGIEGPCVNYKNELLVVNHRSEGTIGKAVIQDSLSFENWLNLPKGSIGNSIQINSKGDLYIADYSGHNILKVENGTKQVEIYAHSNKINQPNDLVLLTDSTGFASDPSWSDSTGNLLFFNNGAIAVIEGGMGTTNGLCLSPSKTTLYVNESIQRKIWKYTVNGTDLSNKSLFHEFKDFGMDGMKCDGDGRLLVTRYGKGEVNVFSPEGELIAIVKLHGDRPTNIVQSKLNKNVYFVTMQGKKWIESFKL